MPLYQRSNVVSLELTSTSVPPSSTTTPSAAALTPESTIAPYYTDLNGVDGPLNMLCRDILWGSLGLVVVVILALRIMERIWNRIRQSSVTSKPDDNQTSWKKPRTGWTSRVKRHLIYASLWNKRHHREYRFCFMNCGTLPSRLHVIFIILYMASNIAYLAILKRDNPNRYAIYAELRGRSGTLSVANMIPLVILAGRNNPLINLLRISFDTYNLFHRWIGRIAVIEIIIHVICWLVPVVADGGWDLVGRKISGNLFIASGLTGVLCMIFILILSLSPIRHAFYETFLNIHIILAIIAFTCTWIHCASSVVDGGLPQLPWIMAVLYMWIAERIARIARNIYLNWSGRTVTNAFCEAMPGEVTRVKLYLPRHLNIGPGTHAYLRFWRVNSWESHPFSIAWVDQEDDACLPVLERKSQSIHSGSSNTTSASFIISARSGVTRKLFNKVSSCPQGIHMKAFLEGPYAGYHNLESYGHAVLFAGAGGITHQISYLRPLLESSNAGTVATRRLRLVWIIRDQSLLEWVRPHWNTLGRIPGAGDILRIKVFVTGRQTANDVSLPNESTMTHISFGRPGLVALLAEEVEEQIGAMCVTVCGPGALADDVRDAVRAVQGPTIVDFIEESFTW